MSPQWQPISDYETPPEALADKELYALAAVWKEQRSRLAGLAEFTERLNREWAIETGLIERLYALDRGVTELLIERGLNAALIPHRSATDAAQTVAMIGDQKEAIDSVLRSSNNTATCQRGMSRSCIACLRDINRSHWVGISSEAQGRYLWILAFTNDNQTIQHGPTERFTTTALRFMWLPKWTG